MARGDLQGAAVEQQQLIGPWPLGRQDDIDDVAVPAIGLPDIGAQVLAVAGQAQRVRQVLHANAGEPVDPLRGHGDTASAAHCGICVRRKRGRPLPTCVPIASTRTRWCRGSLSISTPPTLGEILPCTISSLPDSLNSKLRATGSTPTNSPSSIS